MLDPEKIREIEDERPENVYCECCGERLESGERYWNFDGVKVCEACIDDYLDNYEEEVD